MCTNVSKLEAGANQLSPAASASEMSGSPAACFWSEAAGPAQSLGAQTGAGFAQELIMSLMMGSSGAGFSLGLPPFNSLQPLCLGAFGSGSLPSAPNGLPSSADYFLQQRFKVQQEEPKPNHSYIGLIAMAILSSKDKKLLLSEIYEWILKNYNYFRNKGPGWRNSVRHNLSLNDCFIKVGRAANGKGHYWSIHPANLDDFHRGDFRRRKAQRKVRKHMGLSCPDDEDSSRSPSPARSASPKLALVRDSATELHSHGGSQPEEGAKAAPPLPHDAPSTKKRAFDVESLLQPDERTKMARYDSCKTTRKTKAAEDESSASELEQSQLAQQYLANLSAFCIQQGCSNSYIAALANCSSLNCPLIN